MISAGNRVAEAFQIFEWMVAGCGEKDSVANTPETLKHLFQGCHQAGALEKALEVLSWMKSSSAKPTAEMLAQTEHMIELAQLWDKKVFEKPPDRNLSISEATPKSSISPADNVCSVVVPENLRPAPYDGKRTSYLSRDLEQFEVRYGICFLSLKAALFKVCSCSYKFHTVFASFISIEGGTAVDCQDDFWLHTQSS